MFILVGHIFYYFSFVFETILWTPASLEFCLVIGLLSDNFEDDLDSESTDDLAVLNKGLGETDDRFVSFLWSESVKQTFLYLYL